MADAREDVVVEATDEPAPWVSPEAMVSLLGTGTRTEEVESEVDSELAAGSSLRTRIAGAV